MLRKLKLKRDEYRQKAIEEDLADRKVYLVEIGFKTVLEEEASYRRWVRLDHMLDGLNSYTEVEMLERSITIEGRTYNMRNVIYMEPKIVKESYVKEEIKREMGGYRWSDMTSWEWTRYYRENQIEGG